jgi:hypothetical protein
MNTFKVNYHRLLAGGLGLRLKAGLIGQATDYTALKSSPGAGGFCFSLYLFQTSSVTLPLDAPNTPSPQMLTPVAFPMTSILAE